MEDIKKEPEDEKKFPPKKDEKDEEEEKKSLDVVKEQFKKMDETNLLVKQMIEKLDKLLAKDTPGSPESSATKDKINPSGEGGEVKLPEGVSDNKPAGIPSTSAGAIALSEKDVGKMVDTYLNKHFEKSTTPRADAPQEVNKEAPVPMESINYAELYRSGKSSLFKDEQADEKRRHEEMEKLLGHK